MLLERISTELLLPERYVMTLAATASHRYREYVVKGRTGNPRTVYHPSRALKALQRWLLRRVITGFPVHDAATAYEPTRGIRFNAERHIGSRFLLRMDFEHFFPSLTARDVRTTLNKAKEIGRLDPSWSERDSNLFASLVCRYDQLVIGAPTSPRLSNAICFELDQDLTAIANKYDAIYTRYADDLFFSTKRANVLRQVEAAVRGAVTKRDHPPSIRINASKTRHASKRGRRVIAGLVLTCEDQLSLGRKVKRRLRSQVYRLGTLSDEERASLRGWLAYCRSIEPEFINSLALKFGARHVRDAMSGA